MKISFCALLSILNVLGPVAAVCYTNSTGGIAGTYVRAYNWTGASYGNRTCPVPATASSAATSQSAVPQASFPLPIQQSSDGSAGASPTKQLIPVANPAIDRSNLANLQPSDRAVLNYAEPASVGTYAAQIEFAMTSPQVTLEDSAFISGITKSGPNIVIQFTDIKAFSVTQNWPSSGLVLLTNDAALNPNNERGVYITVSTAWNAAALTMKLQVKIATWAQVATTMTISYGNLVSGTDATTPITTTMTSFYTVSSTRTSTTIVTIMTPIPFVFSSTATNTLPLSQTVPTSAPAGANIAGAGASPLSSRTMAITNSSATTTTLPTTTLYDDLSPAQDDLLTRLAAAISYDASGYISAPVMTSIPVVAPIDVDAQTNDPAVQAANQAALLDAGLPSPDVLLSSSADNLLEGAGAANGITPDMKVTEILPPGYTSTDVTIPVGNSKRSTHYERMPVSLNKRSFLGSLVNNFNDFLTSDFMTALCDACEALSDAEDGYNAAKALYALTHPKSQPPPINKWETTQTITGISIKYPANGLVARDSAGNLVYCTNCGVAVSSLAIKGTIVVVIATSTVLSAIVDVTMSSVSDLSMNIVTKGATSGRFDSTLSTFVYDSVAVAGVFSITPSFIWGIGCSYQTEMAASFSAGASMSLNNAAATLDLAFSSVGKSSNWQPATTVTYPSISVPGAISLSSYEKVVISFKLVIFGNTIQDAARLTTQNNFAFVASIDSNPSKRELPSIPSSPIVSSSSSSSQIEDHVHDKRFSLASILKSIQAAAAAKAQPACVAGRDMSLISSLQTDINMVFKSGSPVSLFSQKYPFGTKCFALPGNVVSSSSKASSSTSATSSSSPSSAASSSATITSSRIASSAQGSSSSQRPSTATLSTLSSVSTTLSRSSTVPSTISAAKSTVSTSTTTSSKSSFTASSTSSSTSASPSGTCPSGVSSGLYTDGVGSFQVSCGTTITSGTFLASSPQNSFQTCATWCESWGASTCVAFYFDPSKGQNCQLYSAVAATGISSTATYASAPVRAACPSGVTAGSYNDGVGNFQVSCGTTVTSGTFLASSPQNSFQTCATWCESWGASSCVAFYFDPSKGQNCQLYSAVAATGISSTATYASVSAPAKAACPSGYSNGQFSRGGSNFDMMCGSSMSGGASIGSTPYSAISDCIDWCNRYGTYCKAATFDPTKYQSCNLYSSVGTKATSSTITLVVRA